MFIMYAAELQDNLRTPRCHFGTSGGFLLLFCEALCAKAQGLLLLPGTPTEPERDRKANQVVALLFKGEGGPHLIGATAFFSAAGNRPSARLPWPGLAGLVAVVVSGLLRLEAAEPGQQAWLETAADVVHLFTPELLRVEVDIYVSRVSVYWALLSCAWYGAAYTALYQGWCDGTATLQRWRDRWGNAQAAEQPLPYAPVRNPVPHGQAHAPAPHADAWELGQSVQARWDCLAVGAVQAVRASVIGAFVQHLERRWHTLGETLKRSRNAKWFRGAFLTPALRREWKPAPLRWWEDDTRSRDVLHVPWSTRRTRNPTRVYDPDLEGGPDPSPWFDWPRRHRT